MRQQFCTQCGAELSLSSKFCTNCGVPVQSAPVPPTPDVPVVTTKPSRPDRRRVRYALAIALVAAVVAIVYLVGARFNGTSGGATAANVAQTAAAEALPDVHDDQDIPYPDVPRISVEEAKGRYDAGKAYFVDVRDEESYAATHIDNALSLPLTELETRYQELPKDAEIITYCT